MAIRVYEISKKMEISNKDLIKILHDKGFDVPSHMSVLSDEALKFLDTLKKDVSSSKRKIGPMPSNINNKLEQKKTVNIITSEVINSDLPIKKMAEPKASQVVSQTISQAVSPVISPSTEKKIIPQSVENTITIASMTVGEFAQKADKPLSEVILTLIRQGTLATKNNLLNEKTVAQLAESYGLIVEAPKTSKVFMGEKRVEVKGHGKKEERLPIVVIMGHVDHGKTTLLDYIRKTRVAAKEKGGITQHLGAYEVTTPQGGIVFLDTPGHEAFSMMRIRGAKVADIAVLIVAADDGVMPQTIEAIKQAKAAELPIIVAINKMDKATPQQVEVVRKQLAQHDLVLEDWGGTTVSVKLSAKTGAGVDELLDVLILQSKLMELEAHPDMLAQGFVLESKIEKGRGPVATVICHNGTLRLGDNFIAGSTYGKVNSLINSAGERVEYILPSVPVSVGGFHELSRVGDEFKVVASANQIKNNKVLAQKTILRQVPSKGAINLIIKTEGASSQEALLTAISKISIKLKKEFYIVHAGIGAITESDVTLASDTKSLIYGIHVKIDSIAQVLSQKLNVTVKLFDIIYKLLENLESLVESGKPVKIIKKKIGEASVLKIFDIKNLGVIAGAQVTSGRFSKDGTVVILRGKQKVGEGSIKSLQRDRKTVKEVHTGFECAFLINGFDAWEVNDKVECYLEEPEVL